MCTEESYISNFHFFNYSSSSSGSKTGPMYIGIITRWFLPKTISAFGSSSIAVFSFKQPTTTWIKSGNDSITLGKSLLNLY